MEQFQLIYTYFIINSPFYKEYFRWYFKAFNNILIQNNLNCAQNLALNFYCNFYMKRSFRTTLNNKYVKD